MRNLLISMVIFLVLHGVAFSQESSVDGMNQSNSPSTLWPGADSAQKKEEVFWEKIDNKTEWGMWLLDIVKPYSYQVLQVMKKTLLPTTHINPTGLSPQELIKKVNAGYVDYYKALQEITPPEALKTYHEKLLQGYAYIATNGIPSNRQEAAQFATIVKRLAIEAQEEFIMVLKNHGVPQNIIKEVVGNFYRQ